ncbi:MAG TPA: protein translocase subunit SecF [Candidatus Eisenbacteria bacterium]|nr:protein translocase subunit SecF [Candidatus Eisenbacteria bacterium]
MHEFFVGTRYKFMARRKFCYALSALLCVITTISLIAHGGPRKSVDFTGGNVLTVAFDKPTTVDAVRDAVEKEHLESAEVQMAEANTQSIIRFRVTEEDSAPANNENLSNVETVFPRFQAQMQQKGVGTTLLSLETVGPKIGKELGQKAVLAILWSQFLILLYIAWRFRRWSFGIGAVVALLHDVYIALGVLSIFNREISLTVIAAFLTISGYSVNDTIVVFDRIRENIGLLRRMSFAEVIDKSVNQTLSRTFLTAGLTLMSVIALFFLGGPVIRDFSLALLVGFVVGVYSSIYVAGAIGMDLSNWWTRRKARAESRTPKTAAVSS